MYATPLDCMLVSLACPVMHVVHRKSGSPLYQSHAINFLQYSNRFFGTAYILRRASNTPYFVIMKRGCNDEFYEEKRAVMSFLSLHNTKLNIT